MSIKSTAFGRVELTGEDAKKFRIQATGRAKPAAPAAIASIRRLKCYRASTR